jgi:4-hydroxy-tetrahydrodipicolinate reductase
VGQSTGGGKTGVLITTDLGKALTEGEVVIDFSIPEVSLEAIQTVAKQKRAMVIGTTGFSKREMELVLQFTKKIPCVMAPNMSVGVNVMFKIVEELAKILGEEYDIEILEAHHRYKKDAPSGTALKLAQIVATALGRDLEKVATYSRRGLVGERQKKEIGIQSIRGGEIVGEHTVFFAGTGESLEVAHRAQSRDNFARGALQAAKWVAKKPPGLYDMLDVLGLREK